MKKTTSSRKKLSLTRRTVRNLTREQMSNIGGGEATLLVCAQPDANTGIDCY